MLLNAKYFAGHFNKTEETNFVFQGKITIITNVYKDPVQITVFHITGGKSSLTSTGSESNHRLLDKQSCNAKIMTIQRLIILGLYKLL